ncbi:MULTISPECIES: pyridoxal-dependent decarboxylase [unclassified Pseudonocardia]|uniref:pyridoxal phosphate-dependent decarboxylase family protein n=1 Tax=unclassified Pseudonocardia TaxID=2619320 RepID=UPI00094B2E16|nr:pyridoxal-dependent decarboxylase [Pseudonocardia sp. Ae707_Ps1]OLM20444.1 L-2,4-diaminobutyrate decarboxylase [Pseudonocardia sp. Ae707_Ps1]
MITRLERVHYSVRSSLGWIGVGAQIVEVDCVNYRYDLNSLRSTLRRCGDRVMAVVAYAGDSRTQTIDQLRAVNDIVRAQDSKIWLHADACWGFLCAFSENLRGRIDGIELYDSITVDAHKIMDVPYSLSALLVREPRMLRMISSYSDLIMQEEFAFGQVTPFVGSRGWLSLKLWMMMQARGISGLSQMAEDRVAKAEWFAQIVDEHPRFVLVNQPDLLAVAFMYVPGSINFQTGGLTPADLDRLNSLNVSIHARLLDEGVWHLHQFSVLDGRGVLRPGFVLHPLRLMANNDRTTRSHMIQVLEYVERLGRTMERASDG